jgi:hypothetical protein
MKKGTNQSDLRGSVAIPPGTLDERRKASFEGKPCYERSLSTNLKDRVSFSES